MSGVGGFMEEGGKSEKSRFKFDLFVLSPPCPTYISPRSQEEEVGLVYVHVCVCVQMKHTDTHAHTRKNAPKQIEINR